jgi:hypothetical protein
MEFVFFFRGSKKKNIYIAFWWPLWGFVRGLCGGFGEISGYQFKKMVVGSEE